MLENLVERNGHGGDNEGPPNRPCHFVLICGIGKHKIDALYGQDNEGYVGGNGEDTTDGLLEVDRAGLSVGAAIFVGAIWCVGASEMGP